MISCCVSSELNSRWGRPGVTVRRTASIDREGRVVRSEKGEEIAYDIVVLATGSYPFVPPIPGVDKEGVFVYRTIEDLETIIEYAQQVEVAAVIGGGLLGLEAAKAAYDLGLKTHVIEFMPRLMPRQVDDAGSNLLIKEIEELGVKVHVDTATIEIVGNGKVEVMLFNSGEQIDVGMVIDSAGIRPRDELARECGIEVGERGGVVINDHLQTSDSGIYAIGEVSLHGGMIYGLVAPGYEMAEILAARLTGDETRVFTGADLSTKLKLMGVDVASFGDYTADESTAKPLTYEDPFGGVYKKLLFSLDGKELVGGILVGDASDYGSLMMLAKNETELPAELGALVLGSSGGGVVVSATEMPDEAQVCQCNGVSKGDICCAIRDNDFTVVGEVKSFTKAGTGCGGCGCHCPVDRAGGVGGAMGRRCSRSAKPGDVHASVDPQRLVGDTRLVEDCSVLSDRPGHDRCLLGAFGSTSRGAPGFASRGGVWWSCLRRDGDE